MGGDDLIFGDDGNDNLEGGDGNDSLNGQMGDDLLAGKTGDDLIVGGEGRDGVAFDGARADFDISFVGSFVDVTDLETAESYEGQ